MGNFVPTQHGDEKMISNFRWFIDDVLAGSRMPWNRQAIRWLHEQGIRAIVSLQRMPTDSHNEARILGMQLYSVLIDDLNCPINEDITRFFDFFDRMRAEKLPLLIHCWAGQGRTGTMGAIALIREGYSVEDALMKVGGVETDEQEEYIRKFYVESVALRQGG